MQPIETDIAINILGFRREYKRDATGSLSEVDIVDYKPRGDQNKTVLHAPINKLQRLIPIEDAGDNMAILAAHDLWNTISPAYEAWKKGEELPTTGTPLAAWAGVTASQAQILKAAGFRTVEEVSKGGVTLGRTGLPGWERLADQAQAFLESEDKSKAAAEVATLKGENDAMKEQLAEMQRQMAAFLAAQVEDRPKRGRPPAQKAEAEDEAA